MPRPLHDWLPESATEGRRVLLIGDIHGCYRELLDLLEKCGYQPGVDVIVSVGDLVNKGPQSVQVGAGAGAGAGARRGCAGGAGRGGAGRGWLLESQL